MGEAIGFNLYVGNVPRCTRMEDFKRVFSSFGTLTALFLKINDQSHHGFVCYENFRDADQAVRTMNNYRFGAGSSPIIVEWSRLRSRGAGGGVLTRELMGPQKYGYRILVDGLPETTTIRDLRNKWERAGRCYIFTACIRWTHAVIELIRDDFDFDVKGLDGSLFRTVKGKTCRVSVRGDF
ncbi:unnamed protein product [Orchesella dallaii]|uniref:RRM domain-containing protein n=1 Tax=Orchesella dallaii TaxID=48710 RepID=A0ABP1PUR6_9HEXA